MRKYSIAVVGATGAVGEEIFRVLEEMDFPVGSVLPLASARSVGKEIEFKGKSYPIIELSDTIFDEYEIDIAFFSAGGSISAHFAPLAAASGAVVIDNIDSYSTVVGVPAKVIKVDYERRGREYEESLIRNNC